MRLSRIRRVLFVVALILLALPCARAADLTIGLGTDVTSLDPHYHNLTPNNNVAQHVYGLLVERNEKEQLQPGLAIEWKAVDPTTWEFKLRRGVKFHDGSDFTAADVVASLNRVPKVPNSPSPFTAYTKQIVKIEVVDPYTIRIHTNAPSPALLTNLTMLNIMPRDAREKAGEAFGDRPVGTGPYRFVEFERSRRLVLEANPTYYRGQVTPSYPDGSWRAA